MDIPQLVGLPLFHDRHAAFFQIGGPEGLAGELLDRLAIVQDPGAERVTRIGLQALQCRIDGDFSLAEGGADLHVSDLAAIGVPIR